MNRQQFDEALAAYGADFARWPDALGTAGAAFAAGDLHARRSFAVAQRLDALLAETVRPATVDAATVGRIMAGISARHERETAVRPTGRLVAWAGAAMAIFLVAGFVLGLAIPAANDDDNALATLMFGSDNGGFTTDGGIL